MAGNVARIDPHQAKQHVEQGDALLVCAYDDARKYEENHLEVVAWAPLASNIYHDLLWYPTIGRSRIRAFAQTEWGRLFRRY